MWSSSCESSSALRGVAIAKPMRVVVEQAQLPKRVSPEKQVIFVQFRSNEESMEKTGTSHYNDDGLGDRMEICKRKGFQ